VEQRRCQANDPRERGKQGDARHHRARQSDASRACLLRRRQLAGEDRDENDVVDAEHDLQHRQREQAEPHFGTREEIHGQCPVGEG